MAETLTHMLFPETNTTVAIGFSFFVVQIFARLWMEAIIALTA